MSYITTQSSLPLLLACSAARIAFSSSLNNYQIDQYSLVDELIDNSPPSFAAQGRLA